MEFKKGDKVNWMGVEGIVEDYEGHLPFPIVVKLNGIDARYTFTKDGREQAFHTEPSLKLVECGVGNCEWCRITGTESADIILHCNRCGKEKKEEKVVDSSSEIEKEKHQWSKWRQGKGYSSSMLIRDCNLCGKREQMNTIIKPENKKVRYYANYFEHALSFESEKHARCPIKVEAETGRLYIEVEV